MNDNIMNEVIGNEAETAVETGFTKSNPFGLVLIGAGLTLPAIAGVKKVKRILETRKAKVNSAECDTSDSTDESEDYVDVE